MRACVLASLRWAFLRFWLPFFLRLCAREARFKAFKRLRKALGLAKVTPSEHVVSFLMLRSTPRIGPVADCGSGCSSCTCTLTNHRPAFSLTVALRTLTPHVGI